MRRIGPRATRTDIQTSKSANTATAAITVEALAVSEAASALRSPTVCAAITVTLPLTLRSITGCRRAAARTEVPRIRVS